MECLLIFIAALHNPYCLPCKCKTSNCHASSFFYRASTSRSFASISLTYDSKDGVAQSLQQLVYGLNERDSIPLRGNDGIFFSSPQRQDLF